MYFAILFLLASGGTMAATAPDLIRQGIATGEANGQLTDDVRDEARLNLNATGTLMLKVTRVFAFQQEGCARLRLDFVQTQALLPGASAPHDYEWSTEMSICSNGRPPASIERAK
ncbi:hypothetical protein [Rhodoferax sp.]|uniref:hypothetical protein n=1 Tax=Rhodoferax sp. TaxID=50421 RepID=UPI002743C946|nr:hypothetical protein [Rhodoferax sp.]